GACPGRRLRGPDTHRQSCYQRGCNRSTLGATDLPH
ncbi:C19orf44 isoform 3, partial [Pongo abelii]